MKVGTETSLVELRIPCKPEFVGVARLAILGVASRMQFSYDKVEDVRLAVGEACTAAVEWAARNKRDDASIVIRSTVTGDKLIVDVIDQAGQRQESESPSGDSQAESLRWLLITLLVDEVAITSVDGGTQVRMVKRVE